jgi:hypothetical protein
MARFLFKLETPDGTPAEPPTLSAPVSSWRPGDTITSATGRSGSSAGATTPTARARGRGGRGRTGRGLNSH